MKDFGFEKLTWESYRIIEAWLKSSASDLRGLDYTLTLSKRLRNHLRG